MKRDAFIRELRKLARDAGVEFEVFVTHGKGSHYGIRWGDRHTILKAGELEPRYVALVKKQLGIE